MISERLRLLRREKGMTKRELVSMLPLNYSTYANYESGFREPNSEVLQMLARYFNVSLDYLMGMTDNKKKADEIAILNDEEHEFILQLRSLDNHGRDIVGTILKKESERINFPNERPLIEHKQVINQQWVTLQVYQQKSSGGFGNYLNDETDNDYELMRFMATPVSLKADFCVRIKGDSMEPKINDGDIVFVKAMPKVDPDSVGIFTYEGESLCRRLRVDYKKGAIYLESLNKAYAPKHVAHPDSLRTVGLVIGIAE